MTPQERAARIADARALLDMLEADESLPLPGELMHLGFYFRISFTTGALYAADSRRMLAALESAIPAEFSPGDAGKGDWTVNGVMPGGVKIQIIAPARDVAEEITTVKRAEVKEWRRLPVEDEPPESGDGE